MKILLYGLNYWPELAGVGKFTGEMAEWLVENGQKVRVITAVPYYPAWKVSRGYSNARYSFETHNGVEISRCPLYVPPRPTGFSRMIHLASFGFFSIPPLFFQTLSWKPDILMQFAPTLFSSPAALIAARGAGVRCCIHMQDFEVEAAFNLSILRFGWLKALALFLEKLILTRFSLVSTITCRMLDRLLEKGIRSSRTLLFPNWVDTKAIFPLNRPSEYRQRLGIPPERLVALYSGTMGEKQGLEIIAEAAQALPDVVFVMCGQGGMVGRLQRLMSCLPNVHFLPLQPFERLNEVLNLADIHLLPQKRNAADLVMPSKLTGIFASGRPVVATADPDTQLYATILKHGLCSAPEDPPAFISAIRRLLEHPHDRLQMGALARSYARSFWDKEVVLSGFLTRLKTIRPDEAVPAPHGPG